MKKQKGSFVLQESASCLLQYFSASCGYLVGSSGKTWLRFQLSSRLNPKKDLLPADHDDT